MGGTVSTRHDHDVAILRIDNPPVNALGRAVVDDLGAALSAAEADPAIQSIVVTGAGRTFVAGADIKAIEALAWGDMAGAPDMHDLFRRLEDCPKPVVMALHGTALGGGLELAMAGHIRVAAADTRLGQPEVNLGLIPGAEGTQRLPRLVGVEKALEMCVTGRPVTARDALESGLIDAIVEAGLEEDAVARARQAAQAPSLPRTRDRRERLPPAEMLPAMLEAGRALAATTGPHLEAPLVAVDAIGAAVTLPFDQGCRVERELFFRVAASEQAKALIYAFFAERAVAKVPGVPKDTSAPIESVAVIGGGAMSDTIARACTRARLRVLGPDAVASADLVIDAAFEDLAATQATFARLGREARPGARLATSTSTLDVDAIAAVTGRPADVIGLHFVSPAHVGRLVEIVRGAGTAPATVAAALTLARRLGTVGVVVGNAAGFVGNRLSWRYRREAQHLVDEGVSPPHVDWVLTEFGMETGIAQALDSPGHHASVERRTVPDGEIVDRLVLALVNEGARVLEEGVAVRAADVDVIVLTGFGFPAFRGGPMFYADRRGLGAVLARIQEFHTQHGERWRPAPLLEQLARDGATFRERDARTA